MPKPSKENVDVQLKLEKDVWSPEEGQEWWKAAVTPFP